MTDTDLIETRLLNCSYDCGLSPLQMVMSSLHPPTSPGSETFSIVTLSRQSGNQGSSHSNTLHSHTLSLFAKRVNNVDTKKCVVLTFLLLVSQSWQYQLSAVVMLIKTAIGVRLSCVMWPVGTLCSYSGLTVQISVTVSSRK